MTELIDLFGGSRPPGPPAVPPVVFHPRLHRRNIRLEGNQQCGHCIMNARRWHDDPASIPQWVIAADIVTLKGVFLITHPDGSTLILCAQHAQEHEDRWKRHG